MDQIFQNNLNQLSENDSMVTGSLLSDNYGLALKAINMNKKSASASKSIADAAKALKVNRDGIDDFDDFPVIVVESEAKTFIIQEKNDFILTVARKTEGREEGTTE